MAKSAKRKTPQSQLHNVVPENIHEKDTPQQLDESLDQDQPNQQHPALQKAMLAKQQQSKQWQYILGAVLLCLCAAFIWLWYAQNQNDKKMAVNPDFIPNAPANIETPLTTPTAETNNAVAAVAQPSTTAIPTDPTLAAEELDRIEDENKQMQEQAALLEKQVAQTEQLIQLKSQQVQQQQGQ